MNRGNTTMHRLAFAAVVTVGVVGLALGEPALAGEATANQPAADAASQPGSAAPAQTTAPTQFAPTQPAAPASQRFALHAQATFTGQSVLGFAAPYSGPNSLKPNDTQETADVTAFLGTRLWQGAEFWVNPELDQGFGLSNTLGAAGFPSGEAYKVGKTAPYFKLPRAFLRQTIALGGDPANVDAAANQLAGQQSAERLVITLGKFSVGDVFDTNSYAHDPRADFMNWAIIDTGTFDYAANAWGFTFGGAAEWYRGAWTLRAGLFNLSKLPNVPSLETDLSQYQLVSEVEHRHTIAGHAGAVRLALWANHGRFLKLADAIAVYTTTHTMPDPASLRRDQTRIGGQIDAEQELTANLGIFLRAGISDGSLETYDFTDIDRTLNLGAQLKGTGWGRADDRIGLAGVINGISHTRQTYLADGGLGVLVGDGRLPHPGNEMIVESYYDWQAVKGVNLTADYQFIANPGYNRDRGPAHVIALRLHGAF